MAPVPISVILNNYLDPSQVALGRLVLDIKDPGQNFCISSSLNLTSYDISKTVFSNFKALSQVNSTSRFRAALSKIFSIFAEKSKTTVNDISSKAAVNHKLLNVNAKLQELLQNEATKSWVQYNAAKGRDMFLVTGLHTLLDADVKLNREVNTDFSAQLQAPVAEAVAPVTAIVPSVGNAVNVNIDGGYSTHNSVGASFIADGERIIAVQYQKLAIYNFSPGDQLYSGDVTLKSKKLHASFGAELASEDDESESGGIVVNLADVTTAADIPRRFKIYESSTGPDGTFVMLK